MNRVRSRLESIPVSKARYQRLSVPLLRGVAEAASTAIGDALGKMWGMPR